jgi:hypothetical protein
MSRGDVTIQAGPDRIAIGGMPALEVRTAGLTPGGVQFESTSVFAFDGATEYYASCQHTPKKAEQVARACGQLMRTFTVSGMASQPGPAAPLSPRAFAAKASGVCVRADQQTPQLPTGHSPLAAANAFGKAARLTDGMLAGFAALEPPAAWQYPFGEFAAHLGQIRDGYAKLTAVMRQGDSAGARSQFRAASSVMSRSSRLDGPWLRSHGMRACTTVRFLH